MLVVSYYTNPKYEALADRLAASLDAFGIPHEIDQVTDRGTSLENRQFKASFLLWKLESHPGNDIVWMDADTTLVKDPVIFRDPPFGDVGMFSLTGISYWSTVVYLKNSEHTKTFLRAWADEHVLHPEQSDPNILQAVTQTGIRVFTLPAGYVWYEEAMRPAFPREVPVIAHEHVGRVC